jgi:hypothetical protein
MAMATIVEYQDQVQPVNEYPDRIVSPSQPSACCTDHMETLGDGRIEGLWRYVYKRCPVCGYTVRSFYAVSWIALAEKWARECPEVAHWRVRLKRKEALLAQGLAPSKRPRRTAFRRSLAAPRRQRAPLPERRRAPHALA